MNTHAFSMSSRPSSRATRCLATLLALTMAWPGQAVAALVALGPGPASSTATGGQKVPLIQLGIPPVQWFTHPRSSAVAAQAMVTGQGFLGYAGRNLEDLIQRASRRLEPGADAQDVLEVQAAQVVLRAIAQDWGTDGVRALRQSLDPHTVQKLGDMNTLFQRGEAHKTLLQRARQALAEIQDALSLEAGADPPDQGIIQKTYDGEGARESQARQTATVHAASSGGAYSAQTGGALDGWTLEAFVGRGGFGEVWRASRPAKTGRETALLKLARGPEAVESLRREAETHERLGQKSLLIAANLEAAKPYIALREVPGKSLRAIIKEQRGKLLLGESLPIIEGILRELSLLHKAGIAHRDVKPENVILEPDGKVRLIDLGLSRETGDAEGDIRLSGALDSSQGALEGTPGYAAPEQGQRETAHQAGKAADLYPLAVIFSELTSKKAEGTPQGEALFLEIGKVMAKAEAQDPAARYSDAGEMLEAVAEARRAAKQRAQAVPSAWAEKTRPAAPARKRLFWAPLSLIGATLLIMAGAFSAVWVFQFDGKVDQAINTAREVGVDDGLGKGDREGHDKVLTDFIRIHEDKLWGRQFRKLFYELRTNAGRSKALLDASVLDPDEEVDLALTIGNLDIRDQTLIEIARQSGAAMSLEGWRKVLQGVSNDRQAEAEALAGRLALHLDMEDILALTYYIQGEVRDSLVFDGVRRYQASLSSEEWHWAYSVTSPDRRAALYAYKPVVRQYSGAFCFVAGTPIDTPAGVRNIEDLKAGDKVRSYDHVSGRVVEGTILETFPREADHYLEVRLADGVTLKVTEEHPFFLPEEGRYGRYVRAKELAAGQKVLAGVQAQSRVRIEAVAKKAGKARVFNFHVAKYNNYFSHGVLVHNTK